ncbi:hypothetical protein [Halorarum halophilum]|uniref:hypothetical protein n=1 Tax=Halorarum halophilum TaxID=2743090 RepID=UPI001FE5F8CD|nr:hypothetical protein [Halobaculum halophilum]
MGFPFPGLPGWDGEYVSVGAVRELAEVARFDLEDFVGPEAMESELERDPSTGFVVDGLQEGALLASGEPDPQPVLLWIGSRLHGSGLQRTPTLSGMIGFPHRRYRAD